jgi:hypothetical protein
VLQERGARLQHGGDVVAEELREAHERAPHIAHAQRRQEARRLVAREEGAQAGDDIFVAPIAARQQVLNHLHQLRQAGGAPAHKAVLVLAAAAAAVAAAAAAAAVVLHGALQQAVHRLGLQPHAVEERPVSRVLLKVVPVV